MAEKKRGDSAAEQRWAKVKPLRLRIRIVAACHLREVTPKEIAIQERLPGPTVQHYFRTLEREGWIHVCRREPVSNGLRNWYTAERTKIIRDREFKQMNREKRHETSEGVLMNYLDICALALREGSLDARPDSHLTHNLLYLDQKTWHDQQVDMDLWLERTLERKVEAEMRLRESSEEPIPTVIHLGAFEVPHSVIENSKTAR